MKNYKREKTESQSTRKTPYTEREREKKRSLRLKVKGLDILPLLLFYKYE